MTNVYLYIVQNTVPLPAGRFNYWCAQIPARDKERVLRFRRWQDAHATLYGRLLLQMAATHYKLTLNDLKYTEYDKPYFEGGFDFNIAHSGDYVICVFARTARVGADIEKLKEVDLVHFESILHPNELAAIGQSLVPANSFFNTWTRKEAIIKADGCGLNYELSLIDTSTDLVTLKGVDWHLHTINWDGEHTISICADKPDFHISLQRKVIE